jgi:hypothetical protein
MYTTDNFNDVKGQELAHIKGIDLCEMFYRQQVLPILSTFPQFDRNHCAALIGFGSEVLGHDTRMSEDHDYGPRLLIFLPTQYYEQHHQDMHDKLAKELSPAFMNFSTHFQDIIDEPGVKKNIIVESGSLINHGIKFHTIESYLTSYWGQCNEFTNLSTEEWLSIPQQRLLGATAGKIYHDGYGQLDLIRENAKFYPKSIWLYMIIVQLTKIGQDVAFVGRASIVDDHLGSQLLVSSLVRDMMRLCFLIEKKYYPYNKWFGTAFKKLNLEIQKHFERAVLHWEDALIDCYKELVHMLNETVMGDLVVNNIIDPNIVICQFHDRPFIILDTDVISNIIMQALSSDIKIDDHTANIRKILDKGVHKNCSPLVGAIDQVVMQTEFLERPDLCRTFGHAFFHV